MRVRDMRRNGEKNENWEKKCAIVAFWEKKI
jgi:hypothetical protein